MVLIMKPDVSTDPLVSAFPKISASSQGFVLVQGWLLLLACGRSHSIFLASHLPCRFPSPYPMLNRTLRSSPFLWIAMKKIPSCNSLYCTLESSDGGFYPSRANILNETLKKKKSSATTALLFCYLFCSFLYFYSLLLRYGIDPILNPWGLSYISKDKRTFLRNHLLWNQCPCSAKASSLDLHLPHPPVSAIETGQHRDLFSQWRELYPVPVLPTWEAGLIMVSFD